MYIAEQFNDNSCKDSGPTEYLRSAYVVVEICDRPREDANTGAHPSNIDI